MNIVAFILSIIIAGIIGVILGYLLSIYEKIGTLEILLEQTRRMLELLQKEVKEKRK